MENLTMLRADWSSGNAVSSWLLLRETKE